MTFPCAHSLFTLRSKLMGNSKTVDFSLLFFSIQLCPFFCVMWPNISSFTGNNTEVFFGNAFECFKKKLFFYLKLF